MSFFFFKMAHTTIFSVPPNFGLVIVLDRKRALYGGLSYCLLVRVIVFYLTQGFHTKAEQINKGPIILVCDQRVILVLKPEVLPNNLRPAQNSIFLYENPIKNIRQFFSGLPQDVSFGYISNWLGRFLALSNIVRSNIHRRTNIMPT